MNYFKYFEIIDRRFFNLIFIFFFLLAFAAPCFSKNYYVSSSTGNDNNEGLTEVTAWKTLNKVSKHSFLPGDSILLKRGDKWNERLKFPSSGKTGNHITLGAYGTGKRPIISYKSGFDYNWGIPKNGIYSRLTGLVYGMWEDGNELTEASDPTCIDGNWWYEKPTLYYKPTSGTPGDHIVEYTSSYYIILIKEKSYINIDNIDLQYGYTALWIGSDTPDRGGRNIYINNCYMSHLFGNAAGFRNTTGYCIVTNNTVKKAANGFYFMQYPHGKNLIANNRLSYINYTEFSRINSGNRDPHDGHAVSIQDSGYNIIRHNTISYSRAPINLFMYSSNKGNHNVIRDNIISNCKKTFSSKWIGVGIGVVPTDDGDLNYTKVYRNIITHCNFGYKPQHSNEGNKFFNNTVDDSKIGVHLKDTGKHDIINNIISHTDNYHVYEEANVDTDNIYNFNGYYNDLLKGWQYRGNRLSQFKEWRIVSKQDVDSVIADPQFSNPAANDFTLKSTSPMIDAGIWLTTITSPKGSGKSFRVADSSYFYDGYNIPGETGEIIKTQSGQVATIVDVSGNTITVNTSINWVLGEGLALNYDGSAPDIGATEYNLSSNLSPPEGLRVSEYNKQSMEKPEEP